MTTNGVIAYNYAYDLRNRVTQQTSVEGTANYNYDGEDQVLAANYSPTSAVSGSLLNESYGHDLKGNRWTRSRGSTSYAVTTGTNNQISDDGEYTYTYDGEGNRITQFRKSPISGASDNYTFYKYDQATEAAERLARMKAEGGSKLWPLGTQPKLQLTQVIFRDAANETTSNIITQVWHSFDVLDRRLTRQNVNASGTVINYDNYVFDGWDVVADYLVTPAGAGYYEVFRYLWAPSDKAGDTSILVSQEWNYGAGYQNRFMLNDHQNSVKDVLGMNSSLTDILQRQHYVYDAYGKLAQVVAAGGTGTNPLTRYQYTTQEFDPVTNLQYSNHRFLHVQTATWMTEDPLEFGAGDTNLRRYVGNDPVNKVDPTGLIVEVCDVDQYLEDNGVTGFGHAKTPIAGMKNVFRYSESQNEANTLTSEILSGMINSKRVFYIQGRSLNSLKFHVNARETYIDTLNKYNGQPRLNKAFVGVTETLGDDFDAVPQDGFPLPKDMTRAGQSILKAYENGPRVGCNGALVVSMQHAVVTTYVKLLGEAEGLRRYNSDITSATAKGAGYWRLSYLDMCKNFWSFGTHDGVVTSAAFNTKMPFTNVDIKDWIPGDGGYLDNTNPFASEDMSGENIIYIGNNKWWGFYPLGKDGAGQATGGIQVKPLLSDDKTKGWIETVHGWNGKNSTHAIKDIGVRRFISLGLEKTDFF